PVSPQIERRSADSLPRRGGMLSLVEIAPLERGDKLLGRAAIRGVVRLPSSREADARSVMEVVVPEGIEAAAPFLAGTQEIRRPGFTLGGHENPSRERGLARGPHDPFQNMLLRLIDDRMSGIEAESVQVILG